MDSPFFLAIINIIMRMRFCYCSAIVIIIYGCTRAKNRIVTIAHSKIRNHVAVYGPPPAAAENLAKNTQIYIRSNIQDNLRRTHFNLFSMMILYVLPPMPVYHHRYYCFNIYANINGPAKLFCRNNSARLVLYFSYVKKHVLYVSNR